MSNLGQGEANASNDFRIQVEVVNAIPRGDLPYEEYERALHELSELDSARRRVVGHLGASALSEELQDAARTAIKRILHAAPSWAAPAVFIEGRLADLAYSPEEIAAREAERAAALAREEQIQTEINAGADPWLTHARHNRQSPSNPLIIGFSRDETGKMRTLYGGRFFQSRRQGPAAQPHAETKEVHLLEGGFMQVTPSEILKGEYWNTLPTDLARRFEQGELLVTTANDLYGLTDNDLATLAASRDPHAYSHLVNERTAAAGADPGYFLLYYGSYRDKVDGRTGVIMTSGDGAIKPLLVEIDGQEYIVEVKGCGTRQGGFGMGLHERVGHDTLTGGAEASEARAEFYRLHDDQSPGMPKAVGSIIFTNHSQQIPSSPLSNVNIPFEQGYIVRLSPATTRASFTGAEAYPDVGKPELVNRILTMFADGLAAHISGTPPKILEYSSHTENILVWGADTFALTDYSDHALLNDERFPMHVPLLMREVDPRRLLHSYIRSLQNIHGLDYARDQRTIVTALNNAFQEHGMSIDLAVGDSTEQVVAKIWDNGMAYHVYRGRRDGGYFPLAKYQDVVEYLDSTGDDAFIASDWRRVHDVVQKLTKYFELELDVVSTAQRACPAQEREELARAQAIVEEKLTTVAVSAPTGVAQQRLRAMLATPGGLRKFMTLDFY